MKKEVVLVKEVRRFASGTNLLDMMGQQGANVRADEDRPGLDSMSQVEQLNSEQETETLPESQTTSISLPAPAGSVQSTFPRHEWKSKVLKKHQWVRETHHRVHPLYRTLQFVRTFDPSAKKALKEKLSANNHDAIVQIILQHLMFEGLKETKDALCEALGCEYRNIDVDGSLLYELVKEAVKKSENLTDLVMDDIPEQRRVTDSLIEQELLNLGFEEETLQESLEMSSENWSVWDEIVELNVSFDERYVSSEALGLHRGVSSMHKELQMRNIQYASLNVLIVRLTSLTKNEFSRLERIWQGPLKTEEEIMKEVHKFYPENTSSYNMDTRSEVQSFVDIFLMTFPSFTTQQLFLTKMMDRFHVPKSRSEYEIQLIEKTIFRVLNRYVTKYSLNLATNFIDDLIEFLKEKENLGYYEAAHLLKNLESSLSSATLTQPAYQQLDQSKFPKPLFPHTLLRHNFQWHHVNPQEIARQLTLIDFEYFRKIQSVEFMNLAWSKPRLKHRASNLLRMIDRFNRLSRWVVSVITLPKQLSERRRIYAIILSIMDHLLQIGNYSSLMAFLGALSNAAVKRLRRTCSNHHSALTSKLDQIRSIMSSQSNHIVYRNTIRHRREQQLSTIPFLGFGQTTLTMAEEGNTEEMVPNAHLSSHSTSKRVHKTLINWEKKTLVHSIIEEMLFFQAFPFYFRPIHQVQVELSRLREELSDDELIRVSTEHGNEASDKHFEK